MPAKASNLRLEGPLQVGLTDLGEYKAIRICHVIVGLDVGGAERALKRLLMADPEPKENYLVVSLTEEGSIGGELRNLGFNVEHLGVRSGASALTAFARLRKLLKAFKPDIVQTWMYHADLLGGLAARSIGVRNVLWGIRNTKVPRGARQRAFSAVCAGLSYSVPRAIVCVAESARDTYVAAGYKQSIMKVIHNGLDFEEFDRALNSPMDRGEDRGCDSSLRIGCVGRWHPDKGQDILIRAAPRILSEYQNAKFILVGRDCSEENPTLADLLNTTGTVSNVLLLGERADVPQLLRQMNVFCMPSRTEGFPNGLAEAMAMNLPCVATDVGDVRLLLGDTGILVPPEDPDALAAALLLVAAMTSAERKAMGLRAGERIREHFSVDTMRRRLYSLYRDVAQGKT